MSVSNVQRQSPAQQFAKNIKQAATKVGHGFRKATLTLTGSLEKLGDKVNGLYLVTKFGRSVVSIAEGSSKDPLPEGVKEMDYHFKLAIDVMEGVKVLGTLNDLVKVRWKKLSGFSDARRVTKLGLLFLGQTGKLLKFLEGAKLATFGALSRAIGSTYATPLGLFIDSALGLASVVTVVDNSIKIRKLNVFAKKQQFQVHAEKWAVKRELVQRLSQGQEVESLKDRYVSARQSLGATANVAAEKWQTLVKDTRSADDLKKLREWKVDFWHTTARNNRLEKQSAIFGLVNDIFKIIIITTAFVSFFAFAVSPLVFGLIGVGISVGAFGKFFSPKPMALPVRPFPKAV